MFICDGCNQRVGPGVTPRLVPAEVRNVAYRIEFVPKGQERAIAFKKSEGQEIAREINLCSECPMPKPTITNPQNPKPVTQVVFLPRGKKPPKDAIWYR